MLTEQLKSRLSSGTPPVGTFVFSLDPATTEIAARAGFDFVIIDREHTPLSWTDVTAHVRAGETVGIQTLVRIAAVDGGEVGHALDAGAAGVVIPHFGLDRVQALQCTRAARYAPLGERGTCTGSRSSGYGLDRFAEVAARANRNAVVMAQIEDAAAVENIDEFLAAVPVDALLPGLADLSTSLGHPGSFAHPKVGAAVDRIFAAAGKRQIPIGFYVANADALQRLGRFDARFFIYSIDYKVVAEGYRAARLAFDAALSPEQESPKRAGTNQ